LFFVSARLIREGLNGRERSARRKKVLLWDLRGAKTWKPQIWKARP
jgi:hypothetical protein